MQGSDWERARGVSCPGCGAETWRLVHGLCPGCSDRQAGQDEVRRRMVMAQPVTEDELDLVWSPAADELLGHLEQISREQGLEFHPKMNRRAWVLRCVERGCCCVMLKERPCPCQEPAAVGCPLLHPHR